MDHFIDTKSRNPEKVRINFPEPKILDLEVTHSAEGSKDD